MANKVSEDKCNTRERKVMEKPVEHKKQLSDGLLEGRISTPRPHPQLNDKKPSKQEGTDNSGK